MTGRRGVRRLICAGLPIWLAACASGGPGAPPAAPAPAPRPAAPPTRRSLRTEHDRLTRDLDGTPVTVAWTDDGALQVRVPLEFCFDRRRSAVQPALAAVLRRIAVGQRGAPGFNLRVLAPIDADGGGEVLVRERAASVRDYLVARGVPRPRIVQTGRSPDTQVEVQISERGSGAAVPAR